MLFLDCYGRVFDLDNNNNILWFDGDYFEKMANKSDFEVAWHVLDDGTLFEFEKCAYTYILFYSFIIYFLSALLEKHTYVLDDGTVIEPGECIFAWILF